jgi:hypothetical protein
MENAMDEQRQDQMKAREEENRKKGERAENIANWYFRLNGFLSIPGFIVHLDCPQAHVPADGYPRHARTEADFMGVRFPYSKEKVGGHLMEDDAELTKLAPSKTLFILVEVNTSQCRMNGPWTNRHAKNMQRVIRRLGFADERKIEDIAIAMYDKARWEDGDFVLQYICVGGRKDPELSQKFQDLVQVDWKDIAHFLLRRFQEFPEKLPDKYVHDQWPDLGRQYAKWFTQKRNVNPQGSEKAVKHYLQTGRCEPGAV